MPGILYLCATPIGNLEDASYRLIRILKEADAIVCEDTRHTLKLLNHYHIKKPLISYHSYSSKTKEVHILEQIKAGNKIALVTDAGMPGISDPGQRIAAMALVDGLLVEIIPGVSAVTAALASSGFPVRGFVFLGFLARKKGKKQEQLKSLLYEEKPAVIFEAPHRLSATLQDIVEVLGPDRLVAVARELTKANEEITRGPCLEVCQHFRHIAPRGEMCIVIAGTKTEPRAVDMEQLLTEVQELLKQGMEKKRAFKIKALEYKISKSVIYNRFLEHQKSKLRPDKG